MNKINPTIARLDRVALKMGIDLKERGVNAREFSLPAIFDGDTHILKYKPGGAGVVRIESYVNGRLDATSVSGPDRIIGIWATLVANKASEGHASIR